MSIREKFSSNKDIEPDQYQNNVVNRLEELQKEILYERKFINKFLSSLRADRPSSNGIYLWGDVGRGKTFLMDLFYETLSINEKDRKHFHRLMENIHNGTQQFKNQPDPIYEVANSISEKHKVICIDEFYVEDIADATIMARLIESLLSKKIRLVMTSNCKPDDLYKNGLQRDLFTPAINKINDNLEVIHIGDGKDFRQSHISKGIERISIHSEDSMKRLAMYLGGVNDDLEKYKSTIDIRNREIECILRRDQLVWFEFDAICGNKRSVKDYIDIADEFKTIVITEVPTFDQERENEARRFIALIDELYDRNIDLFMTTSANHKNLYTGIKLVNEFARTTSRLVEMNNKN